jgi:hypothetical protein
MASITKSVVRSADARGSCTAAASTTQSSQLPRVAELCQAVSLKRGIRFASGSCIMNSFNPEGIARRLIPPWLPMPVIALAVACSGSAANTSSAANMSGGSGGSADTSGGTGAGSAGNADFGGSSGMGSATASGGSSGTTTTGSKCGDLPLPLAKELPEPSQVPDPNATLKEIVISGPASTYATGGTAAQVTNISVSLRDQGVYSDGSVRYIENLTADINYHSQVVWTSSDPTIAGVASGDSRTAGGMQGFRAGTVTITAALGSVSNSVCFAVTPPVVARLSITGPGSTASNVGAPIAEKQGDTVPLTCTESLTDGTNVDVTKTIAWASSDATIATVSSTGATHGLTGGTTAVTAKLPASVPAASSADATATATLDVIGSTGLQQGASCEASPQACAAGLTCCANGRLSTASSCTPTLSPQSPCPMYP